MLENKDTTYSTYEEVIETVKKNGWAIKDVPERFLTPESCSIAIAQYGCFLVYVPKHFRDFEICYMAVQRDGNALEFVPEEIKTPGLCLVAIQENKKAINYTPKEFCDKDNLILTEQEFLEKYNTEELLTSSNTYLRKLGASNVQNSRRSSRDC